MAWTRSAMTRSGSAISAIFASTSLSPSALAARGPRRAAAFTSWACSFIAPRSSSVNPPDVLFFAVLPSAGFCVSVIERFLPASLGCRLCRIHLSDPVRRSGAGPVRPLELARRPEPNRNRAALVKAAPGPSPPPADGSEHYETRATARGLLAAGDQSEPVAVGVFEQRPPAERLLDGRLRELHAAGAQLPVGLLEVLGVEGHVGGRQARTGRGRPRALAKIEHHDHGPVRRAHLQPPLPPVRCVLHELEPQRLGPEHLGPVLVLDLYDDLGHPADHDRHLPPILLRADRLCIIRATMACLHVIAVRLGPAAVLEAVPRVLAGTAWRLHDAIKVTWLSTTTRLIRSSFPCRMRQDIGLVFLRGSFGDEHLRRGAGPLRPFACLLCPVGEPAIMSSELVNRLRGGVRGRSGRRRPRMWRPAGRRSPRSARCGFRWPARACARRSARRGARRRLRSRR